jgi:glutamine synthetase
MNGTLRGKRTDIDDAARIYQNNVNWCAATLVLDHKGGTFDSVPMGGADGDPDLRAHVVPGTLAPVPWARTPTAQAMVETTLFDGTPYFLDSRQVLRRAMKPLTDLGLHPVMAAELEFYLVEHDGVEFAPRVPRIPGSDLAQDGKQYAMMEDLEDVDDFLADVDAWCQAQNVPAGAALAEYAPGQFEINLHHVDDPLRACEHALMLKRVVKAASKKHGLAASFMAKPFGGIPGSGLHIHIRKAITCLPASAAMALFLKPCDTQSVAWRKPWAKAWPFMRPTQIPTAVLFAGPLCPVRRIGASITAASPCGFHFRRPSITAWKCGWQAPMRTRIL